MSARSSNRVAPWIAAACLAACLLAAAAPARAGAKAWASGVATGASCSADYNNVGENDGESHFLAPSYADCCASTPDQSCPCKGCGWPDGVYGTQAHGVARIPWYAKPWGNKKIEYGSWSYDRIAQVDEPAGEDTLELIGMPMPGGLTIQVGAEMTLHTAPPCWARDTMIVAVYPDTNALHADPAMLGAGAILYGKAWVQMPEQLFMATGWLSSSMFVVVPDPLGNTITVTTVPGLVLTVPWSGDPNPLVVAGRVTGGGWAEETGVPRPARAGARLALAGPNPATTSTTLRISAPAGQRATLAVFALDGRRVCRLYSGVPGDGRDIRWNLLDDQGRRVAPGAFVARLETSEGIQARKLIVVR